MASRRPHALALISALSLAGAAGCSPPATTPSDAGADGQGNDVVVTPDGTSGDAAGPATLTVPTPTPPGGGGPGGRATAVGPPPDAPPGAPAAPATLTVPTPTIVPVSATGHDRFYGVTFDDAGNFYASGYVTDGTATTDDFRTVV